jgi:hypothetical protein
MLRHAADYTLGNKTHASQALLHYLGHRRIARHTELGSGGFSKSMAPT